MLDINLYVFDLDGTLLDTAPDFFKAVNTLRENHGYGPSDFDEVRSRVSQGAGSLAEYALDLRSDRHQEIENSRQELLNIYKNCCIDETSLFKGIEEVLVTLNGSKKKWGIVTNKPRLFAEPIVKEKIALFGPTFLICPDDVGERKPSPKGLEFACEKTQISPENTLYVGDHLIDIQAGKAAKMRTVAAAYGYIPSGDNVTSWKADFIINDPCELINIIKNH